jgi:hypothetical protein
VSSSKCSQILKYEESAERFVSHYAALYSINISEIKTNFLRYHAQDALTEACNKEDGKNAK